MMDVHAFLAWVQETYRPRNLTSSVKLAASFLHVATNTVWQWLWGQRRPDASKRLLMRYVVAYGPFSDDSV